MSFLVSIEDLVLWSDTTSQRWFDLVRRHPEILGVPSDIRNSGTVGAVMQHIVAVELRYAERLSGEPESAYDRVPFDSADALSATHDKALQKLRALLADEAFDWDREIEFPTLTAGKLRARCRDIAVHLLVHGVRHYAQLATLVRSYGIKPDWPMDFLFVNARQA